MSDDGIQRSVLPIPNRKHVGATTYDAKDPDTTFTPIEPLRPRKGAPNVLLVLLDDVDRQRRPRSRGQSNGSRSTSTPRRRTMTT